MLSSSLKFATIIDLTGFEWRFTKSNKNKRGSLFVISIIISLFIIPAEESVNHSNQTKIINSVDNNNYTNNDFSQINETTKLFSKMMDDMVLQSIFAQVDSIKESSVAKLKEAVEIPSVSSLPAHQTDLQTIAKWAQKHFEGVGFKTQYFDGDSYVPRGNPVKFPFVLGERLAKAQCGASQPLKTLLIYGHLDVVAASKAEGWDQADPFKMEKDDKGFLLGRGTTDDKGPMVAWLTAFEAMNAVNACLPLNIKLLFETGEEIGSPGLEHFIDEQIKKGFLTNIDYLVVSDNYWLKPDQPCLTYGLRGMVYFVMEIDGLVSHDLHSGVFGGAVDEPMRETLHLLSTLTDETGQIKVKGINEEVLPFKDEEKKSYAAIHLDSSSVGLSESEMQNEKTKINYLARRWRYPTLSVHGFEGSVSQKDDYKAIIPHKIISKFSVRLVPDMKQQTVLKKVTAHLQAEHDKWTARSKGNTFSIKSRDSGAPAWYNEPWGNPLYQAGIRAVKRVFNGTEPDLTREGGSIPAVLELSKVLHDKKNAILLPITTNDGAHSQNEKLRESDFIKGSKLMVSFLNELVGIK